jgi:uncharacterized protein (DUF169 family)
MSHAQQQELPARHALKWTSVKFLRRMPDDMTLLPEQDMRFCEAVSRAGEREWILTPERVCCQGAQRCLGWLQGAERELAWRLAGRMGTSVAIARKAIDRVPVLPQGFEAFWVGSDTAPDVYVSYMLPETAMQIVRQWQRVFGEPLSVQVSGVMAVCGSAVVNSYMHQAVSLTFGCPDSRRYGGIRPEQVVMAMPAAVRERMEALTGAREASAAGQ